MGSSDGKEAQHVLRQTSKTCLDVHGAAVATHVPALAGATACTRLVGIALFVDYLLLSVIIPIVPVTLGTGCNTTTAHNGTNLGWSAQSSSSSSISAAGSTLGSEDPKVCAETWRIGLLFASKALVQMLTNPFVGKWVDKHGSKGQ